MSNVAKRGCIPEYCYNSLYFKQFFKEKIMAKKYTISYTFAKVGINSQTSSTKSVQAETEATAIRIIEDMHPGCIVKIKSIK